MTSTLRYMSGAPFTIFNSNIDVDQNGELIDPSPAATYSGSQAGATLMTNVENKGGRNGAIGPDYFQLDLRAGWRGRIRSAQAVEVFLDIFNITNRANFDNPSGDERVTSTFLVLTTCAAAAGSRARRRWACGTRSNGVRRSRF